MSRVDGFAVMDVEARISDDPKWKLLARYAPDHVSVAFHAYVATMGESWTSGRRVSVTVAWPAYVPFDQLAVDALIHVGLVDKRGLIVSRSWRTWFERARERREKSRSDWRRWQQEHRSRTGPSGPSQGGVRPDSGLDKPIPSVPSVRTPPNPPRGGGRRAEGTNPRSVAVRLTAIANAADQERKERRRQRHLAYLDGRITQQQQADMDDRDASLEELPSERGAAYVRTA